MKISNLASVVSLELVFDNEVPIEENFYLVVGKLEAPNGFVGPHFLVCGKSNGEWYVAPDGPPVSDGLPMWDGHSGTCGASFTPIKWARLPDQEEDEV